MSFWPLPFTVEQIIQFRQAGTLEQKTLRYFQDRGSQLMGSYVDDVKAEGGNKVIDTATKPKDTVGQKFFSNSGEKVENCASFAYALLKEGGLYSEISSSFSSRVSVAATPDKLLDV